MREGKNEKFLQSYLYTEEFGNFFISTIHRRSSARLAVPDYFYETYAWKLDKDKHRTDWMADNSGALIPEGAFNQHFEVCRQLELNGKYEEEEE